MSSDDTWLVFTSSPMDFLCSSWFAMERGDPPTPGALGAWQSMPRFRMEAVEPVAFGVVRAALVNGCTSGRGGSRCEKRGVADDKSRYAELLRGHAEVYPTGESRVAYSSSTLDWIQDALQQVRVLVSVGAGLGEIFFRGETGVHLGVISERSAGSVLGARVWDSSFFFPQSLD